MKKFLKSSSIESSKFHEKKHCIFQPNFTGHFYNFYVLRTNRCKVAYCATGKYSVLIKLQDIRLSQVFKLFTQNKYLSRSLTLVLPFQLNFKEKSWTGQPQHSWDISLKDKKLDRQNRCGVITVNNHDMSYHFFLQNEGLFNPHSKVFYEVFLIAMPFIWTNVKS